MLRNIDTDEIAFLNECNRTSLCCLRAYMTDGRTAGCAGKTAVCDQGYGRTKSHTCNGRSRIQHFTHTRTTLWSLIADHNNITCHNLAAADCLDGILLAVKDSGRAFMNLHLRNNGRTFDNCGIRCQVSFQNGDTAGLAVWILNWTDDLRIFVDTSFDVLPYGLSGYCHTLCVQQIQLVQLIHNGINTACLVQLLDIVVSCRSQMAEVRGLLADGVCHLRIQLYACLMRNGRQMQHTVGGTSQCHIDGQSVQECFFCHDVSWTDILF